MSKLPNFGPTFFIFENGILTNAILITHSTERASRLHEALVGLSQEGPFSPYVGQILKYCGQLFLINMVSTKKS